MNCREWEERIALFVEGDLTGSEVPETQHHVAECAECCRFAAGLKQDLAMLRAAHNDPILPAHFTAVRARVLEQIQRERRAAWRLGWIGASIAAALASVALVAILLQPRPVEPLRAVVAPPPGPAPQIAVPAAVQPVPPNRPLRPRPKPKTRPPAEPLLVKMITDDPDVVIYWIAN